MTKFAKIIERASKTKQARSARLRASQSLKKPKIWSTDKADTEFSIFIRKRDGKCRKCGRSDRRSTCSHFWSRKHSGTRYDPKNNIYLCWIPCHKYEWENEKQGAYRDFMVNWLGDVEYEELRKRAASNVNRKEAIIECMKLLGAIPS